MGGAGGGLVYNKEELRTVCARGLQYYDNPVADRVMGKLYIGSPDDLHGLHNTVSLLLQPCRIEMARSEVAYTVEEALQIAETLGYPVVLRPLPVPHRG